MLENRAIPEAADLENYPGAFERSWEVIIEDFGKAIQLDPNYALAYYSRGLS